MILNDFDLQLLADGDAGGGESAMGVNSSDADYIPGVESSAAENIEQTPDEIAQEFDELVKSKYKDAYNAKFKTALDKRLSSYKTMEENNQKLEMSINLLADKYGVDVNDIDALSKAIENDTSLVSREAAETGNDPEITLENKRLKLEAKMRTDREEKQRKQMEQDERIRRLMAEEDEFKDSHPDFDLTYMLRTNDQFRTLINNGISVSVAYNSIFAEQEKNAAVQKAMDEASRATAKAINKNRSRTVENGINGQSASEQALDVSKMDSKSFLELTEKVMKGQYKR